MRSRPGKASSLLLAALLSAAAAATGGAAGGAEGVGPEPRGSCTEDGCLRWAVHVGDYSREALEAVVPDEARVDNGYAIYYVGYATAGRDAAATVTVPVHTATPEGGWHVVANCPGSIGLGDGCALAGTIAGAGMAGSYGARGLVGVVPDYPGLGTAGLQPYLVSDVEGPAVLDALRAVRQLAAWKGIRLSGRYAVTGLSQGGHATIAAAARHGKHAPELDVRAFGAAAPAGAFEEDWSLAATWDGPHLAYHAMLIHAWAKHYGYEGPAIWSKEIAGSVDEIMERHCAWSPRDEPTLESRLGTRGARIFSASFLKAYQTRQWGEFAPFHAWFRENRLAPYPQTAPLRIYQGDDDIVVPLASTQRLVADLRAGGVEVELEIVPGGGHLDVAFGFLAVPQRRTEKVLAWLRERLDAPAPSPPPSR